MTDFNEDEIDKGFRRVIEGKEIEPPASLWAGIRIAALERQLIHYQSMTLWFKGAVGVLTALLGGTGYFLYQSQTTTPQHRKEVVTITKTDTIYVTKTEKVFIGRPVIVYVYAENRNVEPIENGPDKNELNEENTTLSTVPNKENKLSDEKITQNSVIIHPTSSRNNRKSLQTGKLSTTAGEKAKTGYSELNKLNKGRIGNQINNPSFSPENFTGNTDNNKDRKVSNEAAADEALIVNFLESLPMHLNPPLRVPKMDYLSNYKKTVKWPKPRIPFIDRLSLSGYVSPELNRVDVRRGEPNAFKYGDEELQMGVTGGVRVGINLSEKWSLLTGFEFSGTGFDDRNRRQVLTAESVNGKLSYVYRTALGTVEIPAERLSAPAQTGSVIGLEVHEPIQRYTLNLPLGIRYNVWGKHFRLLNQVQMNVQFYGLVGGYWQLLLRQEGRAEIFENSGREFTGELTQFQNVHNSFGLNAGAGVELGIGRHFNLFVEPNYSQGISSVVKDMAIRSVISSFGLKTGIKWCFGKQ